ncbi:MAG: malonic semialdehyde reductase [Hyphomicrobium sp.]
MRSNLNQLALAQLFTDARTYNAWLEKEVPDELLVEIVELMKWGPTSVNMSPIRFIFIKSQQAKEKLRPFLMSGNVDKTMAAPVTAILGYDLEFFEYLPRLFPHEDARSWFAGKKDFIATSAFRNASLQGGYFILAARALGLDCGPMSGFDNAGVDAAFFSQTQIKSNFLCNLGYGDPKGLYPRSPRFEFHDIAKIL